MSDLIERLRLLTIGRPLPHRSKQDEIESLRSQLAEAQAKLQQAQRDAARYHHVLKLICADNNKALVDMFVQMPCEGDYPTPDEFTAAIDQAMKEGERDE